MAPPRQRRPADPAGSPDGLNPQDPGVLLLARALTESSGRRVVTVCAGEIPGVTATRVVLDLREEHGAAGETVRWTHAERLAPAFTDAGVWPRAHLGKDFTHQCIMRGATLVQAGGRVWCAVRKRKGAEGVERFMAAVLGNVRVLARSRGYRLLMSERRGPLDPEQVTAVLAKRYRVEDPRLGGLHWQSAPGTFSRLGLDAGTAALIDVVHGRGGPEPAVVLDLCCGVGPLGLWAAQRFGRARVVGVDTNLLAVALARESAAAAGVAGRVQFCEGDGLRDPAPDLARCRGRVGLALVNPPTHADDASLRGLFDPLAGFMEAGGRAFVVAARPAGLIERLRPNFGSLEVHAMPGYGVIEAATATSP